VFTCSQSHHHTHVVTMLQSRNITITNAANKSIYNRDETVRRNIAIEMYRKRRAFYKGDDVDVDESSKLAEEQEKYRKRRVYYKSTRRIRLANTRILACGGIVVLCLCTWLSSSAVTSKLAQHFETSESSLFTVSTQFGFLVSALYSSYAKLTTRYKLHHLITYSAICASFANAFIVILPGNTLGFTLCLISRAVVGGTGAFYFSISFT